MSKESSKRNCIFYIVRHGETEWNIKKIIQGQGDSPLTLEGKNQARRLAEKFKNIKFDAIFSSDLLRARKTAEIVALEHNLIVKTKRLFRERQFGKFQGKKVTEFRKELKEFLEKREKMCKKERFCTKLHDDIESDEEMMSRFIRILKEIAVAYPGKKVLVVTHGGIMRVFLVHLGFAGYQELPRGAINNMGYIKFESDGIEFSVKEVVGVKKRKF